MTISKTCGGAFRIRPSWCSAFPGAPSSSLARCLLLALFASYLVAVAAGLAADSPAIPLPAPTTTLPAAPKSVVEQERAIQLPPMIVSETSKAPPWLYVAVGDTEYLSRCSAATTRAFVTAQLEIRQILQVFVPADLLAAGAVPGVSILAPLETGRGGDDAVGREMMRQARQNAGQALPPATRGPSSAARGPQAGVRGSQPGVRGSDAPNQRSRQGPAAAAMRFLPNLRLDDRDMMAVFSYLDERTFRRENLIAAPEYVHSRLLGRTPTLPLSLT